MSPEEASTLIPMLYWLAHAGRLPSKQEDTDIEELSNVVVGFMLILASENAEEVPGQNQFRA